MKTISNISGFILLLIIIFPLILSTRKKEMQKIQKYPNKEIYIKKYNRNRCNNFKKLGPPLGPPLPGYPWPPSL